MIFFRNVSKRYATSPGNYKVILDDLSMDIPRLNMGVLGHNGAGKSTFLRMLSGTILPDSGEIIRRATVSWPLGFAGSFHRGLTGLENSKFVARIYGQDTERVLEYVKDFAELDDFFYMPVHTYSSGMVARLAFGLSLSMSFDYYLVDEVMSVGDQRFKDKSREAFNTKLSNSNLIMVSHSNSLLKQFCDVGAVLHNGRFLVCDNLDDAIELHSENQKSP
jgi:capsular polysaccharide transport system ATP-binding protein